MIETMTGNHRFDSNPGPRMARPLRREHAGGRGLIRRLAALAAGAALAGFAPGAGAAQSTPPEPGEPREFRVPESTGLQLDNGLDVTLIPYGDVPKVTVQLAIRTGNVDEAADQVWLSDLMSDLMEQGTTSRDAATLALETARMGGSFGVNVGEDESFVFGTVLSEFGPELVRLLGDVARNPAFPADELERLKADRIRQVSIARSQPQALAQERFREVLYPGHPYGRLFPTPEMIEGYTVDEIRDFYHRTFGARRAHLYVAGRFDPAEMRRAIRDAFGDWGGAAPADPPLAEPHDERGIHVIDRPGAVQSSIYMGLPVVDPSHPDYVALQVTNALLGGSFASRITSNIREDKGYTYSPFSVLSSRYRDAFWAEIADVTTDVTGAAILEILHEIQRLQQEPPSEQELQAIQNYLAGNFVLQNSSRGGLIGQLRFIELHDLDEDYLRDYVDRVHAVTPDEVQEIARSYIDPGRMTFVVVGDRSMIDEQLEVIR